MLCFEVLKKAVNFSLSPANFTSVLPKECEEFFNLESECGPRKNQTFTTESALVINFPFRDRKCWYLGGIWAKLRGRAS